MLICQCIYSKKSIANFFYPMFLVNIIKEPYSENFIMNITVVSPWTLLGTAVYSPIVWEFAVLINSKQVKLSAHWSM